MSFNTTIIAAYEHFTPTQDTLTEVVDFLTAKKIVATPETDGQPRLGYAFQWRPGPDITEATGNEDSLPPAEQASVTLFVDVDLTPVGDANGLQFSTRFFVSFSHLFQARPEFVQALEDVVAAPLKTQVLYYA